MTADPAPKLIGSEIYRGSSYGAWHPLAIPRVSTVMDLTRALGWVPPGSYIPSPRAKPAALHAWHDPAYVAALQKAEADGEVDEETRRRHDIGTVSNPIFPEIYRRPATAAGGSLLAGELLATGGVIHNPAGGTHHGMPDRAGGFCYLNDPVLGILSLQRNGARRVVYVDIDAHHPDGVAFGFRGEPDVLMISVHEEKRWPFTGALEEREGGSAVNLPVPAGLNDTEFSLIAGELILPLVERFAPDAIVLQCGADAVQEDPLSRLALSNNAHFGMVAALRPLSPRYLVLGGGGYNPWTVGRLWSGVWGTLQGAEMPDRVPAEAEKVLRALSWSRKGRGGPTEALMTTIRDAPREGPIGERVRADVGFLRRREGLA
ncbi:acetoin utilization protein AcuC [Roseicyclus sp. F158]|uniref:Acetoin utilization protein AcuC n=1 Tax=Tropicimonas omnivorans TaxID=3075590 RepID=A0ABU3DGF3_9RHOB|nr:acetoin utilization protein AcuC [Roseicyclus sp. F158]MDT0682791.1 acetoin utilization protein AcuC [Roseicyclus sp. F158]